jgi:hypothetical protein
MAFKRGHKKVGGRKTGVANKRTREIKDIAAKAAENNETPLDYLLSIVNDQSIDRDRRMRAAGMASPYCHPRMTIVTGPDGEPLGGGGFGAPQVVITLPDNHRDDQLCVELGDFTAEELAEHHEAERRRLAEVERNDEELRQHVIAGRLTEAAARIARGYYTQPSDPLWQPPPRPALPQLAYYRNSDVYSEPDLAPAANASKDWNSNHNEISLPAKTVLYSSPNSLYQINGRVYRGDWQGVIEAEAEDVPQLVEVGCKRSRDPYGR